MKDASLRVILPHFVAIFLIIAFWRSNQYETVLESIGADREDRAAVIKQTDQAFSVFLILFSIMTLVHAYYPHLYRFFLPIEYLNEPTINSIGVLLLRLSLAWVVVAQLLLKRAVDRFYLAKSDNPLPVLRAKKAYLVGLLLMFLGMMVTITNVAGIVLCNLAVMLFYTGRPVKNNE